jgi:hypothetical protein
LNATLELLRRQANNNLQTYNERGSKLGGPAPTPTAPRQLPAPTGSVLQDFIAAVKLVPDGNYAMYRKDGGLDFFEVVTRNGRNWVNLLQGAPGEWRRIKLTYRLMWHAARHIAQDVDAAGRLFAQEARACRRCGSPLTNEISRAAGYGPKCIKAV